MGRLLGSPRRCGAAGAVLLAAVVIFTAGLGATQQPTTKPATGASAATQPDGGALTELLKTAAQNSRQGARARARLVNQASAQVDRLVEALKHEDDDVRVSAAWTLRQCGDKRAVGPLTAALRDENFSVARAAAVSLKQFGAVEVPLRALMRDPDPGLRWRGMINVDYLLLGNLMGDVAALAADDPVDFVRADAAWTLRHAAGPEVAEALVKCLADPSARTRYQAGIGLRGKIAGELMKPGSPTRRRAMEALVKVLETHRGKPYATSAAVAKLTELVIEPLGTDPAKWRKFLEPEAEK